MVSRDVTHQQWWEWNLSMSNIRENPYVKIQEKQRKIPNKEEKLIYLTRLMVCLDTNKRISG